LSIIIGSPEKFLTLPLNIIENQPPQSFECGPICLPRRSRLSVPDVLNVESCCILDVIEQITKSGPLFVIFAVKVGVESTRNGWNCLYSDECIVVDLKLVEGNMADQQEYIEEHSDDDRPLHGLRLKPKAKAKSKAKTKGKAKAKGASRKSRSVAPPYVYEQNGISEDEDFGEVRFA